MSDPDALAAYNRATYSREEYKRFLDLAQLDFQPALHVGDMAPDVVFTDLDGQPVRLSDYRGSYVVFEFGCITAPIFISDIPQLNRLHRAFEGRGIQFLIVYAREAHPAENYLPHTDLQQKIGYARDLQRLENVEVPIVVDSLAGDAHHIYGLRPSPVYVIGKDGRILHKSLWLVADELELILGRLLSADQQRAEGLRTRWVYAETWTELGINRAVHERVLNRAGERARADVTNAIDRHPAAPKPT
jgi:hypothetical protein